jgi:DNA-binding NarL/FixJ family response regulator
MSMTSPSPGDDAGQDAGSGVRTILVVDDHRAFADMLSAALNTVDGLTCVGTAATAADGIELAARLRPNIVIMDIQMPGQDGLVATRRIREVSPDTLIAVITAHRDQQWISRAVRAGASAFIPKNGSLDEMLDVLRRVDHGRVVVASSAYRGGGPDLAQPPSISPDGRGGMGPAVSGTATGG